MEISEQRFNLALWAGILAGPFAWVLHLQTSYSLTETACAGGRQWLLHVASLVALLLPIAGALCALRLWRRLPAGSTSHGDDFSSRSRFMALAGIVLSAFFVLVILAQWIPTWILGACAH
jgi:hypothetical protein